MGATSAGNGAGANSKTCERRPQHHSPAAPVEETTRETGDSAGTATLGCVPPAGARGPVSGACRFRANDVVLLDHRGHSQSFRVLSRFSLHAHHFALGVNEDLGPLSDLRGQCEHEIESGTRFEVLVDQEIDAAGRNVAGLPVPRVGGLAFRCGADDYGQIEFVTSCYSAVRHLSPPEVPMRATARLSGIVAITLPHPAAR